MTLEQMVERIRAGDSEAAIAGFFLANPDVSLETLVASALQWGMDDVTEAILLDALNREPENRTHAVHMAKYLAKQHRYAESAPYFDILGNDFPENSFFQQGRCWGHFFAGDKGGVRDAVHDAQQNLAEGQHLNWQSGVSPNNHHFPSLVNPLKKRSTQFQGDVRRGRLERDSAAFRDEIADPPKSVEATTETGSASEIGRDGATFVGRVAGGSRYRFEYGESETTLDKSTPWRPVPGEINARLVSAPHVLPDDYTLYAAGLDFQSAPFPHIRLEWPFAKDPNHISGVGFCDLMFGYWHNGCRLDKFEKIEPWEGSDLRDAKLTLRLSVEDFQSEGFLHCVGVGNVSVYWMKSGEPVDLECAGSRRDIDVSATLTGDPAGWTNAGNNPDEQADFERYYYGPLNAALAENTGNLVFLGLFGDWRRTPKGDIGIRETVLEYRDKNILRPDTGTRLVEFPENCVADPRKLTDGRRGLPEDSWYDPGAADLPLRFVWKLPAALQIGTIVLHQDAAMPVRRCKLTMGHSEDSGHKPEVVEFRLPDEQGESMSMPPFLHRLPGAGVFDTVTLEVLEGLHHDGVGIQALEMFAPDHVPPPCSGLSTVSEDVDGLKGASVYYRLVCETGGRMAQGKIYRLQLPVDDAPILHEVFLHLQTATKTVIGVRGNAMGRRTMVRWQVDGEDWREASMGWEKTAVHRYVTLRDTSPGAHVLKVQLASEAGESRTEELKIDVDP